MTILLYALCISVFAGLLLAGIMPRGESLRDDQCHRSDQ